MTGIQLTAVKGDCLECGDTNASVVEMKIGGDMVDNQDMNEALISAMREQMGDQTEDIRLPPPVYLTMKAEVMEIDLEAGRLKVKFPVLEDYLNPYYSMQGGMVAAAVDNTFGPLSMLVAKPNVTRRLEVKFSQPITIDLVEITVDAKLIEQDGRMLRFRADVRDIDGNLLARANAMHWIVD